MRDAIYEQLLSRQAVKDYNTKYDEELSYEDCIAQLQKDMEFATESVCEQMEVKKSFTWNSKTLIHLIINLVN